MKIKLIIIVIFFSLLVIGFGLYLSGGRLTLPFLTGVAIIVLAAIITIWLVARSFIERIKKLSANIIDLANTELHQKIKLSPKGEVSELEYVFSRLATGLKNSFRQISEQQNQRQALLASIADGLITIDRDSRITLINPAAEAILNLSREKVLGHSFVEATRDYELAEILEQCSSRQYPQTKVLEILPQHRLVRAIVTPLGDSSGEVVITLQDFTELKRLQTLRRELISNIAHELRTPLASLKAILETLDEGAIDDPIAAKSFVSQAINDIDRLNQMAQELSELSRLESAQAPLKKTSFNMNQLLSRVVNRFEFAAHRSGLSLELRLPSELPEINADEDRIEQVVVNLVHNALKFTRPKGNIIISARAEKDAISVTVSDTGIGIQAEDLPHIFERFYKADRARSSEGSGLGLAIVKHIIDAHDGNIQVESTPGKGSTFTFTLPLKN